MITLELSDNEVWDLFEHTESLNIQRFLKQLTFKEFKYVIEIIEEMYPTITGATGIDFRDYVHRGRIYVSENESKEEVSFPILESNKFLIVEGLVEEEVIE